MANATFIDLVETAKSESVQFADAQVLHDLGIVAQAGNIVLSPPRQPESSSTERKQQVPEPVGPIIRTVAQAGIIVPSPPRQPKPSSTGRMQQVAEPVGPIIRLLAQSPTRRFKVLQQWEGVVTKVDRDAVIGDLIDLSDHSKPQEVVELPLEEFPPADQSLLDPGCVFYWIIGHETTPGAQLSRVSEIRVRRTPEWSQRAIQSAKEQGKELFSQFKGNAVISNHGEKHAAES